MTRVTQALYSNRPNNSIRLRILKRYELANAVVMVLGPNNSIRLRILKLRQSPAHSPPPQWAKQFDPVADTETSLQRSVCWVLEEVAKQFDPVADTETSTSSKAVIRREFSGQTIRSGCGY